MSIRMLWVGYGLLSISQMIGEVDGIWRFRQCVMYPAAACASCTVTDVSSGFNGTLSMNRGKCYACCWLAVDDRGGGWNFGISVSV